MKIVTAAYKTALGLINEFDSYEDYAAHNARKDTLKSIAGPLGGLVGAYKGYRLGPAGATPKVLSTMLGYGVGDLAATAATDFAADIAQDVGQQHKKTYNRAYTEAQRAAGLPQKRN